MIKKRKTNEERRAEIDALTEQLNEAVGELTSSDAWLAMLKVSTRFTNYSANNVLLLWMQALDRGVELTRVAGYKTWQTMGRQVVKGAKSFAVMAPVRRRLSVEEATEMTARGVPGCWDQDGRPAVMVRGFRLERVFRIEDTEGEPLPARPAVGYVTGDTQEGAWEALEALAIEEGFTVTLGAETDGARGHTNYITRTVNVDPSYELTERMHILVHELGHIRCDHEHRSLSRSQCETEAESVAFIVCSILGLDLGGVSSVYVGGWTDGDSETITAAQSAIHKAAQSLLARLETGGEVDNTDPGELAA